MHRAKFIHESTKNANICILWKVSLAVNKKFFLGRVNLAIELDGMNSCCLATEVFEFR